MFGPQSGFQPPQQQAYHPEPMRNGPPPAKKAKGNPIITRYPPPPGYQPPGQQQQQPPFQQPGWPPQHHPHSYGQQPYDQPAFRQQHLFTQSQWQGYGQQQQHHAYSQPYSGQHVTPPSWSAPLQASSRAATAANPAAWQLPPSTDPYTAPVQSSYPPDSFSSHKRRHQSESHINPSGFAEFDGNGEPLDPPSPNDASELDDEFNGECYYLRHPHDLDPKLSLGELVWYPARRTVLALPSTFKESQLEIIAPRKDPPPGETSVSEYFFQAKRDEALLSIRQTDEWWKIKGDIIFKDFAPHPKQVLSIHEMLARYRDRPDPGWLQRSVAATPEPGDSAGHTVGGAAESAVQEDTEDLQGDAHATDEDGDILGSLEQALQRNTASRAGRHSRANSTTSITSNHSTKLRPLMPVRDRAQDDVLAALGVTGSPKMVYQTPGPAFGPPPSQAREGSVSRNHSRASSVISNSDPHATPRNPPPPPPEQPHYYSRRPSNYDNRRPYSQQGYYENGYDGSRRGSNASYHYESGYDCNRRGSNASHHSSRPASSHSNRPDSNASRYTSARSGFAHADEDRTPRPKYDRLDSRKRGYEDYDHGYDERDEDATPRQQRFKQPRVDDAYGRRR